MCLPPSPLACLPVHVSGVVILLLDTKMEPSVAKDMVKGAPDPLTSAFHLRYSQLLALARVEGSSPEALLEVGGGGGLGRGVHGKGGVQGGGVEGKGAGAKGPGPECRSST
jgi:hypothetical protein